MSKETSDELQLSRTKIIQSKKAFKVGTWDVLPFDTIHDSPEPLGFLLANQTGEKLLYITDTMYCKYRFNGLTHIMIEANFARDILDDNVTKGIIPHEMKRRLIKTHFSLDNVKEFLKANDLSRVQQIYLIHLSDNNSDEARFKREIQSLTGKPVYIAKA
jgi:phosphoribosyl 1,2-cyclic phosphodiesterase